MFFHNKIMARALLLGAAFLLALAGCGVAKDLGSLAHGRQQLSASAPASASSEEQQEPQQPTDIRLYPAFGGWYAARDTVLLDYATENYRRIFNRQLRYLAEHEVVSTNIILPTGHTLYEDEEGIFLFSGAEVVRVKGELGASLEDPSNPLYDTRGLMHDWLSLGADALYDENGVLVTFENVASFTPVTAQEARYNNLIFNAYDAAEVLDSAGLTVPLSVLGVATLEQAKAVFNAMEEPVMIRSKPYAPVWDSDALTIYYNGQDGFLIDPHSMTLPRKESEQGIPGILDYSELEDAALALYAQKLADTGLAPSFEVTDFTAGKSVTVYNPTSGKIEAVTPIDLDGQGNLSLSLEALRILYGVQLMLDPGTDTLHMYTDPLYPGIVRHILGKEQTLSPVRCISAATADETFLEQQQERAENGMYLTDLAVKTEPGVPAPVIRTPRSGQFVYPGSGTKIWVSYYKGKGEPVSLRPASGDWAWNDATGFWEGISSLSGKMVVWHPSYAAAFTIR